MCHLFSTQALFKQTFLKFSKKKIPNFVPFSYNCSKFEYCFLKNNIECISFVIKPSLTLKMLNAYKLSFFLFSFISMKVFVRRRDYYDSQRHFAFITKGSYSYIVQSWIFFSRSQHTFKANFKASADIATK